MTYRSIPWPTSFLWGDDFQDARARSGYHCHHDRTQGRKKQRLPRTSMPPLQNQVYSRPAVSPVLSKQKRDAKLTELAVYLYNCNNRQATVVLGDLVTRSKCRNCYPSNAAYAGSKAFSRLSLSTFQPNLLCQSLTYASRA